MEDCIYCGVCCTDCIFLDFDIDKRIFKCLIYENKQREPISAETVIKGFRDSYYIFLEQISNIVERDGPGPCDLYNCRSILKFRKRKLPIDMRELEDLNIVWYKVYNIGQNEEKTLKQTLENINKARRLIPNFEDLVEVLNF
jgi:hypothetical protein